MLPGQQGVASSRRRAAARASGIVIPNALDWPGSLICIDIKRENWTLTAGYRAREGQACFLFDPFREDGNTARWNPFGYVSDDPQRCASTTCSASRTCSIPDPPDVDPFWTASARSLFLGIALYRVRDAVAAEDDRRGAAPGHGERRRRLRRSTGSGSSRAATADAIRCRRECVRALYDVIDLAPVTASQHPQDVHVAGSICG